MTPAAPLQGAGEPQLRTRRLLLRRWRARDRELFAAINADPRVMEHFPAPLSRAESDALLERIEADFRARGYGLWAVEVPGEAELAGFVGLIPAAANLPFAPAVEAGWRLAPAFWGRGLAHEGAAATLAYGFETLRLAEILAYTAAANERSRALMERLGMRRDPSEDFLHPALDPSTPLARHVVYRLPAPRRPGTAA
jgi:RimJ/RimL family protein N-acetyltransferase